MAELKIKFSFLLIPLAAILCVGIVLMPIDCEAKSRSKKHVSAPYDPPYAHFVMDADTGIIISQENADKPLYPASLTKLMTLLLTFDALDARRITPSSSVVMTSHAANMPPSRIGLRPGESLSVDNAIKALVTKSANDVAVAMGEKLGGSEERFAQMMTLRARQIGMTQTHFVNASGLHNTRQTSSARDMAKLALYILRTYPHYYSVFSLQDFYFNGKSHHNHNRLMSSYRGMDGMKTGYIAPSGFNLVASAKRGNVRLIGVVFGGKTANSRNAQMAQLLDDGFARIGQLRRMSPQIAKLSPGRPILSTTSSPSSAPIIPPQKPVAFTGQVAQNTVANQPPLPPRNPSSVTENSKPQASYLSKPLSARVAPTAPQSAPRTSPQPTPQYDLPPATISSPEQVSTSPAGWSIQIGAFQDRVSTDQALYKAIQKLPAPLNRGSAQIVPLRTADATWVFRARIGGYTKEQALQACRYLDDCLAISPTAN